MTRLPDSFGGFWRGKPLNRVLLAITILLASFSLALLGGISAFISSHTMVRKNINYTKDLQSQIILSLHYFIEQLYRVTSVPQYDPCFIMLARDAVALDAEDQRHDSAIFAYLHRLFISLPYIESMLFIMPNDKFFSFGNTILPYGTTYASLSQEQWYKRTIEAHGAPVWHESEFLMSFNQSVLISSRQIWDTLDLSTLGVLLVSLNPKLLHDQYKDVNLVKNSTLVIINSSAAVISSSDPRLRNRSIRDFPALSVIVDSPRATTFTTWDGERIALIWNTIGLTNWRIASIFSYEWATASSRNIAFFTVSIGLFSIGFFTLFAWRFSLNVSRPLNALINSMQEIRSGNFKSILHVNSYTEINALSLTFNEMIADIQRLLKENIDAKNEKHETELRLVQSELKALQAQINPHFIYNTLESISTMAKMKNEREISKVIVSLARLLRISLTREQEIISLRQEIEMVNQYVNIQLINYPDRFRYKADIPAELNTSAIVKFSLQPLVENAIFHGFSDIEHQGVIAIRAAREGDTMTIEVSDNGIGIERRVMDALNKRLACPGIGASDRDDDYFGIVNVNSRLKLHFGDGYGLRYLTGDAGGCKARITVPLKAPDPCGSHAT